MSLEKIYEKYLQGGGDSFLNSGSLADLNIPELNDKLIQNRIALLERPIISLEGLNTLSLDNIIIEVLFFLDKVKTYYSGLFNFSDPQFSRIKDIFIKNGYLGDVYVAYGQGYIKEEKRVLNLGRKANKTKLLDADIYPYCKFRLYRPKFDDNGNITFTSLISNIEGHKFDPSKMVKASYGGMGLFLEWFDLGKEIICMYKTFVQMSKLSVTKVKGAVSNTQDFAKELSDILGGNFYFTQKNLGITNEIEREEFCDITDPKEFFNACMLYISQRMNALGMIINPTQKAERVTTGEHYKDLKFAANTESQMLDNLNGFCDELNLAFKLPEKFQVGLTSSMSANGEPKTTENPYDQFKQDFGNNNFNNNNFNKFKKIGKQF